MITARDIAMRTLAALPQKVAREALAYGEWFLGGTYCDPRTGRL